MSDNDCCNNETIMILSCSGGSNVGQLSNQAALELTREGFGRMFCLAGIGGELSEFVQPARDVDKMIVIDGCSHGCAKTCLENARVPLKKYIVVTDLNIVKNTNLNLEHADVAAVKHAVKLAFKYPLKVSFKTPRPLSPAEQALSNKFGEKCC